MASGPVCKKEQDYSLIPKVEPDESVQQNSPIFDNNKSEVGCTESSACMKADVNNSHDFHSTHSVSEENNGGDIILQTEVTNRSRKVNKRKNTTAEEVASPSKIRKMHEVASESLFHGLPSSNVKELNELCVQKDNGEKLLFDTETKGSALQNEEDSALATDTSGEPSNSENGHLSEASNSMSTEASSSSDEEEWEEAEKDNTRKSRKGYSSKGPYRCDECNLKWSLKNDYNQHLVSVHNVKVRIYKPPKTKRTPHTFVCDICSTIFKVKTLFIKHMKDEHNLEKAFKCPICIARFTGLRNMNGHYNKYHNAEEGTKYFCDHCPKVFFLKNRLNRHMATHRTKEEVVNTRCTLCDIEYGSKQSLAQHMSFTHAQRKKTFICEHCGKTYGSTNELKKHVNKHTEENVYPCDRCDEKFLSSSKLKAHELKVHAGIEFKCELCSKQLSCLRNLKCHIKTVHLNQPGTRVRRYQCPHCELKCQSPAQREIHVRQVHYKEKPFLCHLCDKKFCSQKLLSRHLDVHYEFKPHLCPHCGKAFSQKSNMEMHARTHTGEKPYVCSECGKGFAQSSNLKVHMKQHGVNLESRSQRKVMEGSRDIEDPIEMALLASIDNKTIPEVCMDTAVDSDRPGDSEVSIAGDTQFDTVLEVDQRMVPEVCLETPNNGAWNPNVHHREHNLEARL